MLIDPVKAEGLRGVLLVYERDRLAIDNPVVTLDDEILANTVSHEFSAVMSEPKFSGEGRARSTRERARRGVRRGAV
jgi:hypothetical protein